MTIISLEESLVARKILPHQWVLAKCAQPRIRTLYCQVNCSYPLSGRDTVVTVHSYDTFICICLVYFYNENSSQVCIPIVQHNWKTYLCNQLIYTNSIWSRNVVRQSIRYWWYRQLRLLRSCVRVRLACSILNAHSRWHCGHWNNAANLFAEEECSMNKGMPVSSVHITGLQLWCADSTVLQAVFM